MPHGHKTPDIEFANSYDHEGYSKGMLATEDIPLLDFAILKEPAAGPDCMLNDWATVKFKSYNKDELKSPPEPKPEEIF